MVVTNMNYADLDFNLQMQSLLQPGGELEKDGGDDPGWLQNTKCKTENEKYKIQKKLKIWRRQPRLAVRCLQTHKIQNTKLDKCGGVN